MGRRTVVLGTVVLITAAWGNGPAGNATTNEPSECASPPYATHDWIADHALALLPTEEGSWLRAHEAMYLLGTEAPDNNDIPDECGAPNNGYDDRFYGHSVDWNDSHSVMFGTRAAARRRSTTGPLMRWSRGTPRLLPSTSAPWPTISGT